MDFAHLITWSVFSALTLSLLVYLSMPVTLLAGSSVTMCSSQSFILVLLPDSSLSLSHVLPWQCSAIRLPRGCQYLSNFPQLEEQKRPAWKEFHPLLNSRQTVQMNWKPPRRCLTISNQQEVSLQKNHGIFYGLVLNRV